MFNEDIIILENDLYLVQNAFKKLRKFKISMIINPPKNHQMNCISLIGFHVYIVSLVVT